MKKILLESVVTKKNNPFSIIADFADANYMELRAIELIREAQLSVAQDALEWATYEGYHTKIRQAISLLAMARVERAKEEINGTTETTQE